jgi:aspartate 1-decarboxylase
MLLSVTPERYPPRSPGHKPPHCQARANPSGFSILPPCRLTPGSRTGLFPPAMLHQVLKSKLHRAMITAADIEYEGSIEIPTDLMESVGLWAGEKVLVASITTGNRLETYVQPGPPGTGNIIINGGAAHRIKKGERVAIMAFGLSDTPVLARKAVLDEENRIIRDGR